MKKLMKFSEINILASKISEKLILGDTLVLVGDLGAGKTTFVQKLSKSLGINENITSPTFTFVKEYYSGRLPLYHFDVYRINNPEEIYSTGYEDYINGDGIVIIEWGDLIKTELRDEYIVIKIMHHSENKRYIELKCNLKDMSRCEEIKKC